MIEGVIAGAIANLAVDAASAVKNRRRQRQRHERLSEELAPLETEFADALGESIEDRAWDLHSDALRSIATNWEPVLEHINAYDVAFEDEDAAVEWLVTAILECDVVEVDLDETEREELEQLVADAYADAFEQFRERVATDDDLAHRLQADLNLERLDRLKEIQRTFERLADSSAYQLYDFPEDRETIVDAVAVDRETAFVDRPEVPDRPAAGRHFVLGPSGSGKSRVIAERLARLPDEAVEHVLVPEEHLLDTSDARALARESFDGDLLLVWEDLHRVDGGREDGVVRNVLRRLDDALDEQGHRFLALLEAQTGRLEDVFGTLPRDFKNEKSLWSTFDPIYLGELGADQRRRLVERMADRYGIAVDEAAREALVERTAGSVSTPVYVETAFKTATERLTADAVAELAAEVADIWVGQYERLRESSPAEWQVLKAMKYLYDLRVPRYSKLVLRVFTEYFGGEAGAFQRAVRSLVERQWVTVVDEDEWVESTLAEPVAVRSRLRVHDTQLDAVRVTAMDAPRVFHDLILDAVDAESSGGPSCVPSEERSEILFYMGNSLYKTSHYELAAKPWRQAISQTPGYAEAHHNYALLLKDELGRPEEAEEHYREALSINPEFAEAHNNYAVLLKDELGRPEEAEEHYREALSINPEYAEAHNNYAILLKDELGRPEEAEEHYREALSINPEYAEAHHNYANLLHEELGQPEEAEEHYREALGINLEFAEAHYNYANLLREELGQPEEAEEHYREALSINPEYAKAHNNYANLLKDELGRPKEAEEHYLQALDINSEYAEAHYNYAVLLKDELGRPREAEEHYLQALNINPGFVEAHYNYALLLKDGFGRPEEAEEHYREALDINPKDADAHYNYAVLLNDELGRPEEAEEHLDRALDQWLTDGHIRLALRAVRRLVDIHLRNGDTEAAIEYCDTGIELLDRNDGSPEEFVFFTSRRALAEGDAADTEELYVRGLEAMLYVDSATAMSLFKKAWTARTDHDPSPSEDATTTAAGIAFAALVDFFDPEDASRTAGDILGQLEVDCIASPASAVYEQLHDGDSSVSPADLRTQAQAHREEGDDVSALECEAMATLLDHLQ
jgi:tetratricopeptide (TPR) repeat protein